MFVSLSWILAFSDSSVPTIFLDIDASICIRSTIKIDLLNFIYQIKYIQYVKIKFNYMIYLIWLYLIIQNFLKKYLQILMIDEMFLIYSAVMILYYFINCVLFNNSIFFIEFIYILSYLLIFIDTLKFSTYIEKLDWSFNIV